VTNAIGRQWPSEARVIVLSGEHAGRSGVVLDDEDSAFIRQALDLLARAGRAKSCVPASYVIVRLDAEDVQAKADGGRGGREGCNVALSPEQMAPFDPLSYRLRLWMH